MCPKFVTTGSASGFLGDNKTTMQDEQKMIMTVTEARKLAKGSLDDKSDAEVEQLITELDFLAEMFIKDVLVRREANHKHKG